MIFPANAGNCQIFIKKEKPINKGIATLKVTPLQHIRKNIDGYI